MNRLIVFVMSVFLPALLLVQLSAQVSFTNYKQTDGLADDFVSGGVAIDANDVKWFGTQSGLSFFDGTTWLTLDIEDGLVSNSIQCVAVDNSSNIWIGTDNGVSKFNGTTFTNYTTIDGLADNSVLDIECDDSGNIWFASFSGLTKFDGTIFSVYTTDNGLSSNMISRLHSNGAKLYIGTYDAGLIIYNGTNYTTLSSTDGLISLSNEVTAVTTDNTGRVWVGSYAGITVLGADNLVVSTYTHSNGLINNYVQDIACDANGNIVVCEFADYLSDGGISMFSNLAWTHYVISDGLVDVMTKRVEFDSNNFAWITTGGGVSKMNTDAGVLQMVSANSMVYPNPACDKVYIANLTDNTEYKILNIEGRVVVKDVITKEGFINVESLPQGIYFLNFILESKSYTAKIIKN